MTRAEMELWSIRTTIEAYKKLIYDGNVSEEKRKELEEKIKTLSSIRDDILRDTNNYGLEI